MYEVFLSLAGSCGLNGNFYVVRLEGITPVLPIFQGESYELDYEMTPEELDWVLTLYRHKEIADVEIMDGNLLFVSRSKGTSWKRIESIITEEVARYAQVFFQQAAS